MRDKMNNKNIAWTFSILILSMFFVYFVTADYSVAPADGENSITFNEDTSTLINITVNNSAANPQSNITIATVDFTGFTLVGDTNGSNSGVGSTNSSVNITWENLDGLIMNSSNYSFWFNVSIATPGNYNISVALTNVTGINYYNVSIIVNDITNPLIDYGNGTQANNTNSTINWIYVNVSVTELNEANITFLLWNSSSQVNSTNFSDGTRAINWTNLANGTYTYNVTVIDDAGNYNTTATRTFTIDNRLPVMTPSTTYNITTSSVNLNWTTDELTNGTVNYTYRNSTGALLSNLTYNFATYGTTHSILLTGLNASSTYYYQVYSCDILSNCNYSNLLNFTTDSYIETTSLSINESQIAIINITLNNSGADSLENITMINLTLPSGFIFYNGTNGTSASFESYNETNRTLVWNSSDGVLSSGEIEYIWFNVNKTTYGNYNITLAITSTYGTVYSNLSMRVNDTTVPTIDSESDETVTSSSATIEWTTNEDTIGFVEYWEDGSSTHTNTTNTTLSTSHSKSISGLDAETEYDYKIWAYNWQGLKNTDSGTFTTSAEDDDGTSGGGTTPTTGYWTNTISYSSDDLDELDGMKVDENLEEKEQMSIRVDGTRYYIGVVDLTSSRAIINITDRDDVWIQERFNPGDVKKFEINGDNYYDIEIKLNTITDEDEADITVKYLHSLISESSGDRPSFNNTNTNLNTNSSTNQTDPNLTPGFLDKVFDNPWKLVIFIVVALGILLIIGVLINKIGSSGNKEEGDKLSNKVKEKIAKADAKNRVKVKSP
jgi:hypothetical protein